MRKLNKAKAVLVLAVLTLIPGSDVGYAQQEDPCDILYSPARPSLSGAGEMALMHTCGEMPRRRSTRAGGDLSKMPPRPAPAADDLDDGFGSIAETASDVQVNAIPDLPPRTTQNEVSSAFLSAPTGGKLVAAWNDTSHWSSHGSIVGYAVSTDGGTTWTDRGPLLPLSGFSIFNRGDPWIRAHDTTGNFYCATIVAGDVPIARNIIGVYTGKTPGVTPDWPAGTNVTPNQPIGTFEDKPAMDVDNSGGMFDGRVYVCWRQFGGDNNIRLSLNDSNGPDQALTHVDIVEDISPVGGNDTQGCYVEVDQSNGDVYVAWEHCVPPCTGSRTIRARRSVDGGVTFGSEVTVTVPPIVKIGHSGPPCCPGAQVMNGDIRVFEFSSSMAVNPLTGNLHVVYASDGDGAGSDEGDVFHVRCSPTGIDGIGSCTAPFQLNSDATTRDQWHPFIDATLNCGNLVAFWYDRREDPANLEINVYKRFSTDDGVSWTSDEKVTDVSFGVPPLCDNFDDHLPNCYMGEYNHITSDASGSFYFVWGDNRNTVVSDAYPNGRPDPDVFSEKECPPVGACCRQPFGQCSETDEADCMQLGGLYFCGECCPFTCPSRQGPGSDQ